MVITNNVQKQTVQKISWKCLIDASVGLAFDFRTNSYGSDFDPWPAICLQTTQLTQGLSPKSQLLEGNHTHMLTHTHTHNRILNLNSARKF